LKGLIEFDAKIEPGDSGGPLLDRTGRVLGLNTAGEERPDFFTGHKLHLSYAIPIAPALAVADDVVHGRASPHVHVGPTAFLGVELGAGSTVAIALPGSPAEHAGIGPGARLAAVGGRVPASGADLEALLLRKHPGDRIAVVWVDDAGSHRASVALARGPAL
jgi:S1-C subfamily serine protease